MQTISPRPDPDTWTCDIVPEGGRFLDLGALSSVVQKTSAQFSVRGVEATVDGWLFRKSAAEIAFKVRGSGEVLALVPLEMKVQLDVPRKQPQPITEDERSAHSRLLALETGALVRVVGPLKDRGRGAPALEVRSFAPLGANQEVRSSVKGMGGGGGDGGKRREDDAGGASTGR